MQSVANVVLEFTPMWQLHLATDSIARCSSTSSTRSRRIVPGTRPERLVARSLCPRVTRRRFVELTARHRPDDVERFSPGCYLDWERSVRRFVREIDLAGEKPDKRSALL